MAGSMDDHKRIEQVLDRLADPECYDDDVSNPDFDDDGHEEACGSCEWCGTNLYPSNGGCDGELCDKCQWHADQNEGSEDVGGSGIMPIS